MALDSYNGKSMDIRKDPEGIKKISPSSINDEWQDDTDRINRLLDGIQVGSDENYKKLVENGIDVETACIRAFGKAPMIVVAEANRELSMIRNMPSVNEKTVRRKVSLEERVKDIINRYQAEIIPKKTTKEF